MTQHNFARAAAQARVAPLADNWGQEWTQDQLEFVQAFAELPSEEIALALGRTVYAVNQVRDNLRLGLASASEGRTRARRMKALQALPWSPRDPRWG